MSEIHKKHENHEAHHHSSHETEENYETPRTTEHEVQVESHEQHQGKIEKAEKEVERHTTDSAELLGKLDQPVEVKPVLPPNKELKTLALKNYLSEIRSHLGGTSKSFSKFVHQPKVNAISEFSGKTIVRPTAILFGGIFMFAGSAFYLYVTYRTDAQYNFFVALFLFIGGFIAGLIIELIYKLFFSRNA